MSPGPYALHLTARKMRGAVSSLWQPKVERDLLPTFVLIL